MIPPIEYHTGNTRKLKKSLKNTRPSHLCSLRTGSGNASGLGFENRILVKPCLNLTR